MALIGNRSVLHKSPGRFLAGTVASGDRNNFSKPGMLRGSQAGYGKLAALPNGYGATSWMMPVKAGAISSANAAGMSISPSANGAMGLPGEGSATFTIEFATADGGLISSGAGTATFAITTAATALATLTTTGSATMAFSTNTPLLGAIGWVTGESAFSVAATMQSYAKGYMEGSTVEAGLTPSGIASAVWNSTASNFNAAGTTGEKLNGAGSAGNPWTEVIESGLTAAEVLRILASAMAGKVSGAGTGTETFKGLDGTTNRIVSTVDGDGNRTSVAVDGS